MLKFMMVFNMMLKQSTYFSLCISNKISRSNKPAVFQNVEPTGLCSNKFLTIVAKNSWQTFMNFLIAVALNTSFCLRSLIASYTANQMFFFTTDIKFCWFDKSIVFQLQIWFQDDFQQLLMNFSTSCETVKL